MNNVYGRDDIENRVMQCQHCKMKYIIARVCKDFIYIQDQYSTYYCPYCGKESYDLWNKMVLLENRL